MEGDLHTWSLLIAAWASEKPEIDEVWLFGSRVRGDNTADSDLDVAVIVSGSTEAAKLHNWITRGDGWESELRCTIPVDINLEIGNEDIATSIVAPSLKRDGVCVFCRE